MPSPAPPPVQLVLVAEGDSPLRGALTFIFELEGYRVAAFEDGEALLDYDLPDRDACLVIDAELPGLSGVDTLSQLRARGVGLPAVMVTTHPRPPLMARALDAGAYVVEKPLLGDALLTCVRAALAGHRT